MHDKEHQEQDADIQKDTSLQGREEEVIENGDEIQKTELVKTILTKDIDLDKAAEKTYKEGLQNNSDTDKI